jgi:ethanolamine-phosphate cytidylyltransferase
MNLDYVIHGDDPCITLDGEDCYQAMKDHGKFKEIRRTEGVSTTTFITRFLALDVQKEKMRNERVKEQQRRRFNGLTLTESKGLSEISGASPGNAVVFNSPTASPKTTDSTPQQLFSMSRVAQFYRPGRLATKDDVIVYVDGSFDMFNVAHGAMLERAKSLGT